MPVIDYTSYFNAATTQQPINERAEQRRQQAKKVAGIVTANDIQQAEIQKNIEKAARSVQKEQDYQRQKQQWDKQDALPIAQEIAGDIAPVYNTYKFTKNASRDFGRAGQLLSQGYVRPALGYGLKGVGNFGFGVASLFPFTGILKQAPNIVKRGIQTIGRNTTFKNKVARKIAEKSAAKTAGDHSLFIADVYKGGNIRDPNFSFFTTDPEYAKNYGDVSKYKLEIKHPYVTETPLITTKDPVNNDMFIFDIVGKERFDDARMGIIGHDLHTGEFPKSKGLEILSLDRDNIIIPTKATPSTSLAFFERPQAKLTEAERLGIPRGERNLKEHGFKLDFISDKEINDMLAENFYRQESHELGPKLYKEPTQEELDFIKLTSDEYGIPKESHFTFEKQYPNPQNTLIHVDEGMPLIVTSKGFKPLPVHEYRGIGTPTQETAPYIWWNRNFPYYRPADQLTYKGHLLKIPENKIKVHRPPYQNYDNSVVVSEGLLPYENLKGLKWNADQSWFEREIFMPSKKESDYFKQLPPWTTFKSGGKLNYLNYFK